MSKGKGARLRRSVSFDDDVVSGVTRYRGHQLIEGKNDPRFGPAVNELLREILMQKGLIEK